MKKVLVVAYHYPPSPAVGAVRPSKFVRYLPEFGWEPTVLTVATRENGYFASNGDNEIYRVREWPHPLKARDAYKIRRHERKEKGGGQIGETAMGTPFKEAMTMPHGGIADLKRSLLLFFRVPDLEGGWLLPAVWNGRRLIRQKNITHVITTGPPFTCHLIGLALQRLTGIKWIADFRDPWSLQNKWPMFRSRATDLVEARLIGSVMSHVDLAVLVTASMTEQAINEHSDLVAAKFLTLTNGFDSSDFAGVTCSRRADGPVIFAYLGTFYWGRTPEPFLRALRLLIDEGAVSPTDVRINFVGHVMQTETRSVPEMICQLDLGKLVTVNPPVPRSDALKLALEAHVLIVLDEQHPIQVPLKFYEALGSGAIILNIGSGGAVANLLAATARGVAVDHKDLDAIKKGILECIRRVRAAAGRNCRKPWLDPAIQDFNFRSLTQKLAGLLDGLGPG